MIVNNLIDEGYLLQPTIHIAENLAAYYKCDDNAASAVVLDATGGSNGASVVNTSLMTIAGKISTALDFDGIVDKVNLSSDFGITGDQNRAVGFWVYPTSDSTDQILFGQSQALTDYWNIKLVGGFLQLDMGTSLYTTGLAPTLDEWNYVLVSLDGSTMADHTIYLNNVKEIARGDDAVATEVSDYFLGSEDADADLFVGRLDEVSVFNESVSEAQATQLFNSDAGFAHPFVTAIITDNMSFNQYDNINFHTISSNSPDATVVIERSLDGVNWKQVSTETITSAALTEKIVSQEPANFYRANVTAYDSGDLAIKFNAC